MQDAQVIETDAGWRKARGEPSLIDVFRSIKVRNSGGMFRRALAFVGPGYLVSVGYMDPGNWATSIAGGAQFGYTLLFVALLSNIMAIILQSLCARLAIGSGRDLAQACRDAFPKSVSFVLWLFAEIAIIATDIAEVVGTAIGLNLLFGIPLEIGVIITALDVFVILWLQRLGFRWVEAFIISLLGVIFVCFFFQIAMADPDWGGVIRGIAPTVDIVRNPQMLYLALGIIGATVMPHNLYLHSGIVQTRDYGHSLPEKREALRFATWDSTVALMFALLVNASILILAAATFYKTGRTDISNLGDAHAMLAPLLGSLLAPKLFAISLLACGLNSTVTATLGGPNRDGGLPQYPPARLAAAAGDAHGRHRPSGHCDNLLRDKRHGGFAHPQPGCSGLPTALRHCAFGDVHAGQVENGCFGLSGLVDLCCRDYCSCHYCPQCQADLGFGGGLSAILQTPAASLKGSP